MSFAPKKLQANQKALRVFFIGYEKNLTHAQKGETVWTHFKHAFRELKDKRARRMVNLGRGRPIGDPILYLIWTSKKFVQKSQAKSQWKLTATVPIDRAANEEDLYIFQVEQTLATGNNE